MLRYVYVQREDGDFHFGYGPYHAEETTNAVCEVIQHNGKLYSVETEWRGDRILYAESTFAKENPPEGPEAMRNELLHRYKSDPAHYIEAAERIVNMTADQDVYTINVQFSRCKSDDACLYKEDFPNMPEKVQALFQFWLELQGSYDGDFAGHYEFCEKTGIDNVVKIK